MTRVPSSRPNAVRGDITTFAVDAIVNAANEALLPGGGVSGSIHRAAGPGLLEECRRIGGCRTGEACLTRGHNLPARYVIHTVGPVWHGGHAGEDRLLASCYRSVMAVARAHRLKSLAFPAIGTGIYRVPLERATEIAVRKLADELARTPGARVTFVCFDEETLAAYQTELARQG